MTLIECEISRLIIDEESQSGQMIALREKNGTRSMPIIIGMAEAWSINQYLTDKAPLPRPLTHDLFTSTLAQLDTTLNRVLIVDLRESTFYAILEICRADGAVIKVDSRPSDALALAVRTGCPIFVAEEVLVKSASGE